LHIITLRFGTIILHYLLCGNLSSVSAPPNLFYVFKSRIYKEENIQIKLVCVNNIGRKLARHLLSLWSNQYIIKNDSWTIKICKPLRSKHCHFCKSCIEMQDHHCLWLDNCVGAKNNALFNLLLIVVVSETVTVILIDAIRII